MPNLTFLSAKSAAQVLGALVHAVSKDEQRDSLTHVHVQRSGSDVRLTAADGHRLAKVTVSCDINAEDISHGAHYWFGDVEAVLALAKASAKSRKVEPFNVALERIHDGAYPSVDHVMLPTDGKAVKVWGINPTYLADAAKVASGWVAKGKGVDVYAPADSGSPMRIDAVGPLGKLTLIIMPMRR